MGGDSGKVPPGGDTSSRNVLRCVSSAGWKNRNRGRAVCLAEQVRERVEGGEVGEQGRADPREHCQ